MTVYAQIDQEKISSDDIAKHLALTNRLGMVLEEIVQTRLFAKHASNVNYEISDEELQRASDEFRRDLGLYRAEDTYEYFESRGLDIDDFEFFVRCSIAQHLVIKEVASDKDVEEYYQANKHRFDLIECSHIVVDSEDTALEVRQILNEDTSLFPSLVDQLCIDEDTSLNEGKMGSLPRGTWPMNIESMLFEGQPGDIFGPIKLNSGLFEIVLLEKKHEGQLTQQTRNLIKRLLLENWSKNQTKNVEVKIL